MRSGLYDDYVMNREVTPSEVIYVCGVFEGDLPAVDTVCFSLPGPDPDSSARASWYH